VNSAIPVPPSFPFTFNGVAVRFPFKDPHPAQRLLMSATVTALQSQKHALLESPTGTGKTIALLSAMLGYFEAEPGFARIYYTSRTHSQLAQVVRELKRLSYFPKMAVCASRKHLCIYPPVLMSNDPDTACKEADLGVHGPCPFDRAPQEIPYFSPSGPKPKFDLEDLLEWGRARHLCPFYAAKHLAATADLIICPYNYLLTPGRGFVVTKACAVVFDEGHNIDSFTRSMSSLDFSYNRIHVASNDAAKTPPTSDYLHIFRFVRRLTLGWLGFITRKRGIYDMGTKDIKYLPGEPLEELIIEWEIDVGQFKMLGNCLLEWSSKIEGDPPSYHDYVTPPLLMFAGVVGGVLALMERDNLKDFRVAFIPADKPQFDRIVILCMRPAILFSQLANNARTVVITSATLSPLNSLGAELETLFDVQRLCPHVASDAQIVTMTVSRHNGVLITSQFRHMADRGEETLKAVGRIVADIIQVVPGGSLLFMPSYTSKVQFLDVIQKTGLRRRIDDVKKIIEEEPSKTGRELLDEMQRKGGAGLLLGVCRGKMSEGMDFPNDAARIVMVFGIPYASFKEADIELKMQYNDDVCQSRPGYMTGHEWYEAQAFRALFQSIGRCVRHASDYGAIVLMDWRIDQHLDKFPLWTRRNLYRDQSLSQVVALLASFCTAMHRRFPQYLPPPKPSLQPYDVKPVVALEASPPRPSPRPPPPPPPPDPILTLRQAPGPVIEPPQTKPDELRGTVLHCMNCERPIVGVASLSVVNFLKVTAQGYLMLSKNAKMASVDIATIEPDIEVGLATGIAQAVKSPEDECTYEQLICECRCVVGLRVAMAAKHCMFRPGTVTLLIRCLAIEFNGQLLSLDELAKMVG
jgi:Rad3-related DNA helicase